MQQRQVHEWKLLGQKRIFWKFVQAWSQQLTQKRNGEAQTVVCSICINKLLVCFLIHNFVVWCIFLLCNILFCIKVAGPRLLVAGQNSQLSALSDSPAQCVFNPQLQFAVRSLCLNTLIVSKHFVLILCTFSAATQIISLALETLTLHYSLNNTIPFQSAWEHLV